MPVDNGASLETILGVAQRGKARNAISCADAGASTPGGNGCGVHTQEWVALQLAAKRHRQRRSASRTQAVDFVPPQRQFVVVRVDRGSETAVGRRVLVCCADQGCRRKLRQMIQGGQQLRRCALEQPPAAKTEQGVTTEQHAFAGIGDMAARVAGYGNDREAGHGVRKADVLPSMDAVRGGRDSRVIGSVNSAAPMPRQRVGAGDVVGVMVGKHNAAQCESMCFKRVLHDVGITRIDHQRITAVMQQPDVVVAQRWQRNEMQQVDPCGGRDQGANCATPRCPLQWRTKAGTD